MMTDKEFEDRIQSLGKRVGDFEAVREKVKVLSEKFESYISKNDSDANALKNEYKALDVALHSLIGKNITLLHEIKSIKDEKNLERCEFTELYNKTKSIDENIQKLEFEKEKQQSKIDELINFQTKSDVKLSNLFGFYANLSEMVESSKNEICKLNSKEISNIWESIEVIGEKLIDVKCKNCDKNNIDIDRCLKSIESLESYLKTIKNIVLDFPKIIDSKISEIEKVDTSKFIDKESIDKLRHEINLSSLDAKNACSKSNNNEMQNQLILKRLDGIQIALKSNELGNAK